MSDCSPNAWRHKGRFEGGFHEPTGKYWKPEERRELRAFFTDGTSTTYVYNALVGGAGRELAHFEADGRRYEPIDWSFVEHYEGGGCVAVEVDGVMYRREPAE